MALFNIASKLTIDTANFTASLQQATRNVDKFAAKQRRQLRNVQRSFQNVASSSLKMAGAITAAFTGGYFAINRMYGDFDRLTYISGLTTAQLQKWSYAAELADLKAQDFAQGIGYMNRVIAESLTQGTNIDVFKRLGLDPKTLQASGAHDSLKSIIIALQKIENTGDRTSVMRKLFGDDRARQMLKFVAGGMASIEESFSNFERFFGAPIDTEQLAKINDLMSEIKRQVVSLIATFLDLKVGDGDGFAEDFAASLEKLRDRISGLIHWFEDHPVWRRLIVEATKGLLIFAAGIGVVAGAIGALLGWFGKLFGPIAGGAIAFKKFGDKLLDVGWLMRTINVESKKVAKSLEALRAAGEPSWLGSAAARKASAKTYSNLLKRSMDDIAKAMDAMRALPRTGKVISLFDWIFGKNAVNKLVGFVGQALATVNAAINTVIQKIGLGRFVDKIGPLGRGIVGFAVKLLWVLEAVFGVIHLGKAAAAAVNGEWEKARDHLAKIEFLGLNVGAALVGLWESMTGNLDSALKRADSFFFGLGRLIGKWYEMMFGFWDGFFDYGVAAVRAIGTVFVETMKQWGLRLAKLISFIPGVEQFTGAAAEIDAAARKSMDAFNIKRIEQTIQLNNERGGQAMLTRSNEQLLAELQKITRLQAEQLGEVKKGNAKIDRPAAPARPVKTNPLGVM